MFDPKQKRALIIEGEVSIFAVFRLEQLPQFDHFPNDNSKQFIYDNGSSSSYTPKRFET